MAHYIDKDAVVAEIDERIKAWKEYYDDMRKAECYTLASGAYLRMDELEDLKKILNTLEEKEVDLEKFTEKINTFQARYKHPEITSIKGAMAFMARMFYQYPNVAREWYESLPKATID